MNGDPTGPNPDTLKHLHSMLHSFVEGLEKKRSIGKGSPVLAKPRKICKVCGLMFDKVFTKEDVPMESVTCDKCEHMFKDGCVAVVCGDKYAFVKSERLSGGDGGESLVGQIIHLQPHNMAKIEKEFQLNWETKNAP